MSEQSLLNSTETSCDDNSLTIHDASTNVAVASVLITLPVLTCVVNILVYIKVTRARRHRTYTNIFVMSLATADLFVAMSVMPFDIYQQFNNYTWNLGRETCMVAKSLDVMFTTTSIFHLSCLSADRYVAICKPFAYKRWFHNKSVCVLLTLCWVVPFLISFVLIFNELHLVGIENIYRCTQETIGTCFLLVNLPYAITCSLIAFYGPSFFMILSNLRIYLEVRKHSMALTIFNQTEVNSKKMMCPQFSNREARVARTIGIMMGCFFCCWLPFFILTVIDPLIGYRIHETVWEIATWLGYVNSAINPILFLYFSRSSPESPKHSASYV